MTRRGVSLATVLAMCMGIVAAAQTRPADPPVARGSASTADFTAALEALRPSNALGYFELAEEVADQATDAAGRELARHLFSLAAVLDPEHLGHSACLALADIETDPLRKRRYEALASLLASDRGDWQLNRATHASLFERHSQAAVLAVTDAISFYRRGDGAKATIAMKKPGAMALLQECDVLIPGGAARFLEDIKLYRGQSRPTLSAGDHLRLLHLEQALLSRGQRSWTSELLVTGGAPLIEVDPNRLADSLQVNASKPLFRRGLWVSAAEVRTNAPASPPPATQRR